MQRGNLVIYDLNGKVWSQTGEAEGDIIPHDYPVGIPYMEIPYGIMNTKRLIEIDVSQVPNVPIFIEIVAEKSEEQLKIEELENQLLFSEGVI